jgi:hypothetical protein
MSDLPEIRNGAAREEISYGGEPLSHFQKQVSLSLNLNKDNLSFFFFTNGALFTIWTNDRFLTKSPLRKFSLKVVGHLTCFLSTS